MYIGFGSLYICIHLLFYLLCRINSLYWTAVCGRPRKRFMPKDFKELVQAYVVNVII